MNNRNIFQNRLSNSRRRLRWNSSLWFFFFFFSALCCTSEAEHEQSSKRTPKTGPRHRRSYVIGIGCFNHIAHKSVAVFRIDIYAVLPLGVAVGRKCPAPFLRISCVPNYPLLLPKFFLAAVSGFVSNTEKNILAGSHVCYSLASSIYGRYSVCSEYYLNAAGNSHTNHLLSFHIIGVQGQRR